jgi:hypothetical protein
MGTYDKAARIMPISCEKKYAKQLRMYQQNHRMNNDHFASDFMSIALFWPFLTSGIFHI